MQTNRILLRPWRESDAETLFKYASDPEVGPRAGWPPHKSVEESLNIIRTVFSTETMWAVEWKETGEAIGCVGYLPASASNLKIADDQCEVGYWIACPYWGKGICTEALQLVVDYCFHEKGFSVLWGDYFPENPASGRVMEKCGFVDTGEEVLCPNLEVGADKPVKVMKLEKNDYKLCELTLEEQAYWKASIERDMRDRAEGKPQEYLSSEEFWSKLEDAVKNHYDEANMIAYCGLDCEKCDAYIATKNNDQALREKTAKLWSELNNVTILPEHINCEGCRVNGVKTFYCEKQCQIRQCAMKKGMATCGECSELGKCQIVGVIIDNNTDALNNLKNTK